MDTSRVNNGEELQESGQIAHSITPSLMRISGTPAFEVTANGRQTMTPQKYEEESGLHLKSHPIQSIPRRDLLTIEKEGNQWMATQDHRQTTTPAQWAATGHPLAGFFAHNSNYLPSASTENQSSDLNERFAVVKKAVFIKSKEKGLIPLTDFVVEITEIVRIMRISGKTTQEISIRIISSESEKVALTIPLDKYKKLNRILEGEGTLAYPQFQIFPDHPKASKLFKSYLSFIFKTSASRVPRRDIYEGAGWWEIQPRQWKYLSASDDICRSKRRLPDIVPGMEGDCCKWALNFLNISRTEIMLPIFIHAHNGVLMQLFALAGYPIQEILGIVGPSGSGKTSLARAIYCLFDITEPAHFTDTNRSIELMITNAHDSVLLIDDLYTSNDRELRETVTTLIGRNCDSVGRAKSTNGGKDLEQSDTRCALVFTAESDVEWLQLSRKLRVILVQILEGDIDFSLLQLYQKDAQNAKISGRSSAFEYYITLFIKWLEAQFWQHVQFISTFQPPVMNLRFSRQATAYRQFACVAYLILQFLYEQGVLTQSQAEAIYQQNWLPTIQTFILSNQERCEQTEPWKLFLVAISEGISLKRLRVGKSRLEFERASDSMAGFWDTEKGVLKLIPAVAYEYICDYCKKIGKGFSSSMSDLAGALRDHHCIEVYGQKNHKAKMYKRVKINGIPTDFLCLIWEKAQSLIAQSKDTYSNTKGGVEV